MINLYWPSKLGIEKEARFREFAQRMANRLVVGIFRYDKGKPTKAAEYLKRLEAEVKAYRDTHNLEHLVNAANYCYLEAIAPTFDDCHYTQLHKSVTRDTLKMKFNASGYLAERSDGD